MAISRKSRWSGVKKIVSCATAAALALCLTPASAFAVDTMGTTFYDLPKASDAISTFSHSATENGETYNYKYVTVGAEGTPLASRGLSNRIAPMIQTYFEVVGLNYTSAYGGPDSIFTWTNTQEEGKAKASQDWSSINTAYTKGDRGGFTSRNASLVLMGTNNNENPDEYIWNYCCWANGATGLTETQIAQDAGNGGLAYVSATVNGTTYTNYPRQVYWETDIIQAASGAATYGTGSQVLSWAEWVKLEQQRQGGNKDYNPYFASFSAQSGSAATMVAGLHTLADTVDSIVAKSATAKGNFQLQSRYGGNRADGTGAMIDYYEDIVQGPEYYVLSKLADKTAEKAVTAVLVGYDPETHNYACRKYNTDKDPEGNQYGGRIANYLAPISMSITEKLGESAKAQNTQGDSAATEANYVVWYTPQQIAENCDAAFVCDAESANNISTYLATSTDGKCHTVYCNVVARSPETEKPEDNTADLEKARADAATAGKNACDFCYSYPTTMFGNFYAQGVENGLISLATCAYTYPQLFKDAGVSFADLLAYWAKYVWHIKDASLASIVTGATSAMHLSTGQEVGTVSANWKANADKIINAGNVYYLSNFDTVDKINGGCLKTYDKLSLANRTTGVSDSVQTAAAQQAAKEAQSAVKAAQDNVATAKAAQAAAQAAQAAAEAEATTAKAEATTAKEAQAAAEAKAEAANKQVASLTKQLESAKAANTTVTVNKATVKASDIPATATTVILGTKVTKVAANAFKGKKVTTVFAMTKKLTKAKVKNCFKSSKVKTVQVPGSKYAAYKKIFTKANCGKKVTID